MVKNTRCKTYPPAYRKTQCARGSPSQRERADYRYAARYSKNCIICELQRWDLPGVNGITRHWRRLFLNVIEARSIFHSSVRGMCLPSVLIIKEHIFKPLQYWRAARIMSEELLKSTLHSCDATWVKTMANNSHR